jgi:PAS domain S-box-containing protein
MAEGKTEAMARQLEAAQAITHVGSWQWDILTGAVTWSDELYRIYGLQPRSKAITFDVFLSALHPLDKDRIRGEIEAAMASGGRFSYRERIIRPNGDVRILDTVGEVLPGADGKPCGLIGTCRDVTQQVELDEARHRHEHVQTGERQALEMLAAGAPLQDVLTTIVLLIESLSTDTIASILLLDSKGKHLRHGAAPHLPESYNRAIDGAEIGPRAGSCGTAAYRKEPVFVTDIPSDPLWIGYRHLVEPFGLRACWSFPICASGGHVIGTFAVYYRESRAPDSASVELIKRAAHVAGIAIERRDLDEQLRNLATRIEAVREEERTNIAREIHDVLGQALTALKLDIAWVGRRSQGDLAAKLAEMGRATDEIIGAVRRKSAEQRQRILDNLRQIATNDKKFSTNKNPAHHN